MFCCRRCLLRGALCDEQRPERADGDHDDGDRGLGLQPEYGPCGIDLAVADVAACDLDDGGQGREYAETQDAPKCQLMA